MSLAYVAAADRFVDLAGLLGSCEVDGFHADFVSWGHYRPEYWRNYWHSHSFHEVCLAYSAARVASTPDPAQYDVRPGRCSSPDRATSTRSSRAAVRRSASPSGASRSVPARDSNPGGGRADPSGRTRHFGADWLASRPDRSARGRGSGTCVRLQHCTGGSRVHAGDGDRSGLRARRGPRCRTSGRDRGPWWSRRCSGTSATTCPGRSPCGTSRRLAHLSERHAERLFQQQTGASIMSTLRRLRLELAAQLLLEPARHSDRGGASLRLLRRTPVLHGIPAPLRPHAGGPPPYRRH